MTNTERGFLDDIIANPEDNVPRLIYADWLEDHGTPNDVSRGRFIRRQIAGEVAQAPLFMTVDAIESLGLEIGSKRVASAGKLKWVSKDKEAEIVWTRGFLAEIRAPFAVLKKHLPGLVRRHPIERVRATDKEPQHFIEVPNVWPEHWTWWQDQTDDGGDFVGEEMIALLEPGLPAQGEGGKGKNYPTADATHAALSVALLRWAKTIPRDTT